jgi:hypothetical protein
MHTKNYSGLPSLTSHLRQCTHTYVLEGAVPFLLDMNWQRDQVRLRTGRMGKFPSPLERYQRPHRLPDRVGLHQGD